MAQQIDYKRKTADQLRLEAENTYNPLYNAEKQSLEQRTSQMMQGLEGQRGGIDKAYDNRLTELKDMIGQSRTNAGNEALSRGFGRSTFVQDKLSDIDQRGTKATDGLEYDRGQEHIGLDGRIGQLNSQLADSLSRLDMDKASKISDMLRQLESQDYQNYTGATQYNNSLQMQQQQQALQRQQFDWQKLQAMQKQKVEYERPTAQQRKTFDSYMANISRDPSLKTPEQQLDWLETSKDFLMNTWGEGLYHDYAAKLQGDIKNMPQIISDSYYKSFVGAPDKAQWLKTYGKELSKKEYEELIKLYNSMESNSLL